MRHVDIDMGASASLSDLYERLRSEQVHEGDHLRLHLHGIPGRIGAMMTMAGVFLVLSRHFAKPQGTGLPERVRNGLFGDYADIGEFGRDLEQEFGVRISLLAREPDDREWSELSMERMAKAYGVDEPDYSLSDVREPSPRYGRKEE